MSKLEGSLGFFPFFSTSHLLYRYSVLVARYFFSKIQESKSPIVKSPITSKNALCFAKKPNTKKNTAVGKGKPSALWAEMPLLSDQQRKEIGETLHGFWFTVCSVIPLVLTVAIAAHVLRTIDSTTTDDDDVNQFQGFAFLTMPLPIAVGLAIFLVGVLQEYIVTRFPTEVSQTRIMQAIKQESITPSTNSRPRTTTTYTCDIRYSLDDNSPTDDAQEQRWFRIHAQGKERSHAERLYEYAQTDPDMRRILVWSRSPSRYSIVLVGNDNGRNSSSTKTCIYTVFSSLIATPLIGCSLTGFSGSTKPYVWGVALLVFYGALLQYWLLFWMTGAAGGHTAQLYHY